MITLYTRKLKEPRVLFLSHVLLVAPVSYAYMLPIEQVGLEQLSRLFCSLLFIGTFFSILTSMQILHSPPPPLKFQLHIMVSHVLQTKVE